MPRRIFDFGAISKDETEKQKDHGIHSRPHDAKVRQKTLFLTAFSCRPALQFLGQVWFNKDLDRLRSLFSGFYDWLKMLLMPICSALKRHLGELSCVS